MSDELAALREAMVQDSVASVRALAAAERAVEEGRLNVAKILRASAHASRRRALIVERVLAQTVPSTIALREASNASGAWAALASAAGDDAAVRVACAVRAAEERLMQAALASLHEQRDVSERDVAQFVWGCAECGYLVESSRPEICPACGAFSAEFEMFAPFFSATADHLSRRQPAEIVAMLSGDAARLEGVFAGVPDAILSRRPAEGEWCTKEIAGHMLDIADVACRRLTTMIDPGAVVAPDRHMLPWKLLDGQGYESMDASELVQRFTARVADALGLMASLDDAGWRRRTEWVVGKVSAVDLGSWLANHNLAHQQQIDALLETAS